jgi:hypothetical protein
MPVSSPCLVTSDPASNLANCGAACPLALRLGNTGSGINQIVLIVDSIPYTPKPDINE